MIFDRIMLPAQGRNEDYKFAQTGTVTLAASVGGAGGAVPTSSWLENVIKLDPESGFLSVDDWHVKGDLIIEGQVNQWLAQQLVVDDARIQVNRRQDGAVVDSGLVIFDKDTSSEVSSLVFDVNGIWKAGGEAIATKPWVENSATAYNSARLGGVVAANYLRSDIVDQFKHLYTGYRWTSKTDGIQFGIDGISGGLSFYDGSNPYSASIFRDTDEFFYVGVRSGNTLNGIVLNKDGFTGLGIKPTERLHVAGNGLFSGAVTAGGNVGTSNFVSQTQGWRVTPAGVADFRHIYTDELQAKAFTADISQALVGSDVLTKSVAKLAQNWATTANGVTSTIYVEELEGFPGYQVFAVGDRLLLRLFDRSGGGLLIKNIWATVASYVSTTNNVQRYTITVNSGGVTGQTVYAGSMILDYGTPGSGVIERTVLDQQGSPYSRVSTWTGSPDNPANYTLHYQSGNLNGIPNAEGWGVYSENSFLTGKLLVGDLTKAGQYMEYKDGQLNIKGQITVTGGNAATKADVDAIQVGGRNLILNSSFVRGYDNWGTTGGGGSHIIATGASDYPSMSPVKRSAKWTNTADAGQGIVTSTTGSWPLFENGKEYVITCWVKASSVSLFSLHVYGDSGDVVDSFKAFSVNTNWQKIVHIITGDGQSNPRVRFFGRNNGVTYWVNCPKVELGNKATDWTPAPEDIPSALDYLTTAIQDGTTEIEGGLVNTNVLMVKDTNGEVSGGISGLASDNVGFWTGGTYQAAIDNNANVIFRKDGSFSLAGGKISGDTEGALSVDGGIITGVIQSENWDGTQGSKFNLLDGSLEFGNTIKVDSFAKEIIVTDRDTQNTGVRIGDFLLSPVSGGAGALDVDLSGSRTVLPRSPLSQPDPLFSLREDLTYINSSGVIGSSSVTVSTNLTAGNNYTFQTNINARITRGDVLDTATDPIGAPLTIINSISRGGVWPWITVSLFSGATKVGERSFSIIEKSDLGVATFSDQTLSVNIPFTAASNSLRVEITQSGEVVWKVRYPASQGNLVEFRNAGLVYSELDAASRVRIIPSAAINELSAKGFLSLWGPEKYFRIYDRAGVTNFIEARGAQMYISPNGVHRLRVTDTGIQKSNNSGVSWTTL